MMRKIMFVFLGLSVRGMMAEPLFGQTVSPLIQESNTEHIALAPGGTIRINDSYGELNIEGWNQPEAEITVIKTLPYDYEQSKTAKELNIVRITTERKSDRELLISTTVATHDSLVSSTARTKPDVKLEYQIHAPRDAKLVIHHGNGSVHVNNMAAEIDANSSRGDIVVMLPDPGPYSIDAKTQFGTIASDFQGKTRKKHFVGRTFVSENGSASPVIHLRMGYGGITVKTLPKEAYTADQ
jgi:Putative adhesin